MNWGIIEMVKGVVLYEKEELFPFRRIVHIGRCLNIFGPSICLSSIVIRLCLSSALTLSFFMLIGSSFYVFLFLAIFMRKYKREVV